MKRVIENRLPLWHSHPIHWTFLIIIPLFAWIIGSQISMTVELISGLFSVPSI